MVFPTFLKQAACTCGLFAIKSGIIMPINEDLQPQVPQVDTYKAIYDECINERYNELDNSE